MSFILSFFKEMKEQLNRIEFKLDLILKKENKMDATIQQILDDVTAETTLESSIITLLSSVEAQLQQVLSNTVISPADQAKVNSIFANLESNKAALAAAIAANTQSSSSSSASA